MFRAVLTVPSLSGARDARGPRPSFRPGVESLEDRVVPAGMQPGEDLGPSIDHSSSPQVTVTKSFSDSVNAQLLQAANLSAILSRKIFATDNSKVIRNLLKIQRRLREEVALLELVAPRDAKGNLTDRNFEQAHALFKSMDAILISMAARNNRVGLLSGSTASLHRVNSTWLKNHDFFNQAITAFQANTGVKLQGVKPF